MPAAPLRSKWQDLYKINFNSKVSSFLVIEILDTKRRVQNKYMLKLCKSSEPTPSAPIAPWDNFKATDLLLLVKGAPEVLLSRCKFVLDPAGGEPIPLSPPVLERISRVQEQWARDGQRVLLLARRVIHDDEIPKDADPESEEYADFVEAIRDNLIIVGLVGLIDPLKPSIPHVVQTCRAAGIRFFVVTGERNHIHVSNCTHLTPSFTGDHPTTAVAIAAQAGIISRVDTIHHLVDLPTGSKEKLSLESLPEPGEKQGIVLTGPELEQLTEAQVEQLCRYQEIVFARTTPEQKLRIVHEFKRRQCIVAMTGDGVNDAPSLKAADCEICRCVRIGAIFANADAGGIAMGEGSDVAREAADMVLLDDFSAIVVALEYGMKSYFWSRWCCLT